MTIADRAAAPNTRERGPFTCERTLNTRERAPFTRERALNTRERASFTREWALNTRERASFTRERSSHGREKCLRESPILPLDPAGIPNSTQSGEIIATDAAQISTDKKCN